MIQFCCLTNDKDSYSKLEKSIESSMAGREEFDLDYHICKIYNDDNTRDIFSGYDMAAEVAEDKDVLVFVHQDVQFLGNSLCWAEISDLALKPSTGIIGPAGTMRLENTGIWWEANNMLSGMALHGNTERRWATSYGPYGRVVVLDGVCLVMRKKVWSMLGGFSKSNKLHGYDFYDIDICMRATVAGYRNYTAPILLYHDSHGDITKKPSWHTNRKIFLDMWKTQLPISITE